MENFIFYSNESSPIDSNNDNNQHHKNKQIMNAMLIPRKKPIYRPHYKWIKEEDEKIKELIKNMEKMIDVIWRRNLKFEVL